MSATITGLLIRAYPTEDEKRVELVDVEADEGHKAGYVTHLSAMYRLIGCRFVDVVRLPEHLDVWFDDEPYDKPDNILASLVIETIGNRSLARPLRGNVLFLGVNPQSGEAVSLTDRHNGMLSLALGIIAAVTGVA